MLIRRLFPSVFFLLLISITYQELYHIEGLTPHKNVKIQYNLRYVRDTTSQSKSDSDDSSKSDDSQSGSRQSEAVHSDSSQSAAGQSGSDQSEASQNDSGQSKSSVSNGNATSDEVSKMEEKMERLLAECEKTETCTRDNHTYYTLDYIPSNELWIELTPSINNSYNGTELSLSQKNTYEGIKYAVVHTSFLFYGLPIEDMMILTAGFIHVGKVRTGRIIDKVQYISPFMAEFNPNASEASKIYKYQDDKVLIIQWDHLQINKQPELGNYTFQVQLHDNSDIVFAYKEIPTTSIPVMNNTRVTVNNGINDAYFLYAMSHITLNVYHEIQINMSRIHNGTAVRFTHEKLCTMINDCYNCTNNNLPLFDCHWCDAIQKCSDRGLDNSYHTWLNGDCVQHSVSKDDVCPGYCYKPKDFSNTSYTPEPVIPPFTNGPPAMSKGDAVKISCDVGYSIPVTADVDPSGKFTCKGGDVIPKCNKSCEYLHPVVHGKLEKATLGHSLRPGSEFNIACDAGHRLKNKEIKNVKCIDNGILEPDPQNVICQKYCRLPQQANAEYIPQPEDLLYLHEGENTTLTCRGMYALRSYLSGLFPNETLRIHCTETSNFSSLVSECVGYCQVRKPNLNTTVTTLQPMVGENVTVSCREGSILPRNLTQTHVLCSEPGKIDVPQCETVVILVNKPDRNITRSKQATIVFLVILILVIVVVIGGWVTYAYRNPTTPSGMFLIEKCRPWTWRSNTYRRHEQAIGETYYLDGNI